MLRVLHECPPGQGDLAPGIFSPMRWSVFTHSRHTTLLAQGFFGKGELSRGAADGIFYLRPPSDQSAAAPVPSETAATPADNKASSVGADASSGLEAAVTVAVTGHGQNIKMDAGASDGVTAASVNSEDAEKSAVCSVAPGVGEGESNIAREETRETENASGGLWAHNTPPGVGEGESTIARAEGGTETAAQLSVSCDSGGGGGPGAAEERQILGIDEAFFLAYALGSLAVYTSEESSQVCVCKCETGEAACGLPSLFSTNYYACTIACGSIT